MRRWKPTSRNTNFPMNGIISNPPKPMRSASADCTQPGARKQSRKFNLPIISRSPTNTMEQPSTLSVAATDQPQGSSAPPPQEQLKIVIVGHVDHGKSTFVGRLFHDTGSLPEGKLEQLQKVAERRGVPFEWANLMDALQSERDQNITIDTAQIWFHTKKRQYEIGRGSCR